MVSVDFSNHERIRQVVTQLLIFASSFFSFFYLDLMSKDVGKIKLQVYFEAINSCLMKLKLCMVVTDINKVIIYLVLIFVACIQEK